MKTILSLSIILAAFALSAMEPQFIPFNSETLSFEQSNPQQTVEQRGTDLLIQWQFSGMQVTNRLNAGIPFEQLSVAGYGFTRQVGAPALPAHTDILALRSADAHLEITGTETIILDGYRIYPALEPARDTQGAPEPSFVQDAALYQQDAWYPASPVRISQIQYYREVPLAFVEITPIQYNPASGQIRIHTQLSYRLSSNDTSDAITLASSQNSDHALANLRNYVLNADEIGQSTAHSREDAREYIIITHSNYLDAANDLAAWKQQLGYSVEVVSQSSWTSAQVKDAIHTRYASYSPHPDYFVIIGDHTGSYAVPGEIHQDPSYGDDFATDLYYACMNGTGDVTPDMAHGRISASTAAEAQVIVDKIINYEKNPVNDASYYSNGVNCAQYQDDDNNGYADRRFCHTSEDIRDYLITQGYSVDRIYYTDSSASVSSLHYNDGYYSTGALLPSELRSGSFDWAGGAADITSAINAGKFYVFHRDHGYVGGSGWAHPYYTTTSMTSLSNGAKLPVVFSINCHTGEFQLDNCFAEKLMRMENKGAVGVVAAAYYSYSGYNDGFATGMVDAIWHEPGLTPVFGSGGVSSPPGSSPTSDIITMGDVINQGLIRMVQTWGSNTYTNELFHYFGDPAMKIWTANPYNAQIAATITPSPLYVGDTSISIAGCTVSNPLVTVIASGEIIAEQNLSGTSGTVSFAALDASVSQVVVTLSARNAKPMESIIAVLDAQPQITTSPASFSELLATDETTTNTLTISNTGEAGSALSWNILVTQPSSRSIEGSTFTASTGFYEPGTTVDLVFTVYNASPDDEWLDGASLDFPTGITVLSSTDFSGGTYDLVTNNATGNGAEVIWSDTNGGYGNIYDGETATATINLQFAASISGTISLPWTLSGDDWAATPHDISGTITLEPLPAELTLTSPNGGEQWAIGAPQTITWSNSGSQLSTVALSIYRQSTASWQSIDSAIPNTGSYLWTPTAPADEQCRIKVSDPADPTTFDESNSDFRLYQSASWLSASPASGSILAGASNSVTLSYDASGLDAGSHVATLEIQSNDPAQPTITKSVTLQVIDSLAEPAQLTVQISGTTVTLSWDAVAHATSYEIYSAASPDGNYTLESDGNFSGTDRMQWTKVYASVEAKRFYRVIAKR
jgi:hypothetical protein